MTSGRVLSGASPARWTAEWLAGRVDAADFPNACYSYTREEALNLPTQAFCPEGDSDY